MDKWVREAIMRVSMRVCVYATANMEVVGCGWVWLNVCGRTLGRTMHPSHRCPCPRRKTLSVRVLQHPSHWSLPHVRGRTRVGVTYCVCACVCVQVFARGGVGPPSPSLRMRAESGDGGVTSCCCRLKPFQPQELTTCS